MKNKTVAVTGSRGFLGSEIVKVLRKPGFEVIELSKSTINYHDVGALTSALIDVEILVHTGWSGISRNERDNAELQKINIEISKNLILACQTAHVSHFVGLGSQAEFGNQHGPFEDNQQTSPSTHYGFAKCSVLEFLQESNLDFTWARIFSAYGQGDNRDWIFTRAVNALKNKKELRVGNCSQLWSFTHKLDIAYGVQWIIENNIFEAVNLSSLEVKTLRSYIETLENLSGQTKLIKFIEDNKVQNDIYPSEGKMHISGWKPQIHIAEGFTNCLKS